MTFLLRRHADLPVTPWKNGGGRTREVYLRTDAAGEPLLRVSMAEVAADGPFSAYPGVARTLTVLTGDPLALVVDGQPVRLGVGDVLAFDGGVPTTCTLTGTAVEDLGVMVWPDDKGPARHASMELVPVDEALLDGSVVAVVATGGGVTCNGIELVVGDALVRADGIGAGDGEVAGPGALAGPGVVAVVREA